MVPVGSLLAKTSLAESTARGKQPNFNVEVLGIFRSFAEASHVSIVGRLGATNRLQGTIVVAWQNQREGGSGFDGSKVNTSLEGMYRLWAILIISYVRCWYCSRYFVGARDFLVFHRRRCFPRIVRAGRAILHILNFQRWRFVETICFPRHS